MNTLAILSLVFAFVFAPAGAVLGHLALSRIARTGERGRPVALAGLVASYAVVVGAVAALVLALVTGDDPDRVASTPTPTAAPSGAAPTAAAPANTSAVPAAPTVDAAALPGVLLPLPELQTLIDDPGQTPLFSADGLVEPRPELGTYSDTSPCLASYARGTAAGYRGNAPVAYVGEDTGNTNPGRKAGQTVRQGAALFADDAAARRAFDAYVELWRSCAGRNTVFTPTAGPAAAFVYGTPEELAPGVMAVRTTSPDLSAVQFVHVIAVEANVLVDNSFNGLELGDIPTRVTTAMLDRIPG